ncbi:hypothetical protein KKA15_06420 [Patescibacteria group bacterium]|nr:hypothetical protein [Patescibacteria group bacterium]
MDIVLPNWKLISVSDKKDVEFIAEAILKYGNVDGILSTGGTATRLDDSEIPVREVADFTGFKEMMDGRVKTLHPKIHAGILAKRENIEHMKAMRRRRLSLISIVVVNLYPFQETVAKEGVKLEDAIEQIDIGGPTMLRAAAKNYRDVVVICNPDRYQQIAVALEKGKGTIPEELRYKLACEVFEHTEQYDRAIAGYLAAQRN